MNIANNIRRLRLENNMTQEMLARAVGVVPQAVSKWERDEGMPDISLLPALAAALGCSADALLGLDESMAKQRRDKILQRATELLMARPGQLDPEAAEAYMREQLQEFPNEWTLWYQLGVYLIYGAGIGSEKPNMAKFNEALEIYERIRLRAPSIDQRTCGVWGLIMAYTDIGDYKKAAEVAEELPAAYLSYEGIAPLVLRGDELRAFLKAELLANLSRVENCIHYLTEGVTHRTHGLITEHMDSVEERIALREVQAGLWEQLADLEWASLWATRAVNAMEKAAEICMESGSRERALDYLERAAEYCRPRSGEKPGTHAVHKSGRAVYNGETENIIPSREAAKFLQMIFSYARDVEGYAFSALVNEPRWIALESKLEKYLG